MNTSGIPLKMPSFSEFANLRKWDRGKTLPPSKRYLDKVHLDIIYGNSISKQVL